MDFISSIVFIVIFIFAGVVFYAISSRDSRIHGLQKELKENQAFLIDYIGRGYGDIEPRHMRALVEKFGKNIISNKYERWHRSFCVQAEQAHKNYKDEYRAQIQEWMEVETDEAMLKDLRLYLKKMA
jgi:hypothetical protein